MLTFIAGNFAYGAVPVASSIAVIPKLQISALLLYAATYILKDPALKQLIVCVLQEQCEVRV